MNKHSFIRFYYLFADFDSEYPLGKVWGVKEEGERVAIWADRKCVTFYWQCRLLTGQRWRGNRASLVNAWQHNNKSERGGGEEVCRNNNDKQCKTNTNANTCLQGKQFAPEPPLPPPPSLLLAICQAINKARNCPSRRGRGGWCATENSPKVAALCAWAMRTFVAKSLKQIKAKCKRTNRSKSTLCVRLCMVCSVCA